MKNLLLGLVTALALVGMVSSGAWAQSVTQDPPQVLTISDPDGTGYPFINNWKSSLSRDVKVFLTRDERQRLTQSRVDQSVAMRPIFEKYNHQVSSMLYPDQRTSFAVYVARQDMERIAAMSSDDYNGYVQALCQEANLDASQEDEYRSIAAHLRADLAPVHDQYAAAFDQVIAAADARVAAERATWTASVNSTTATTPGPTVAASPVGKDGYPLVLGLKPFSSETGYKSLAGYLRSLVWERSGVWLSREEAVAITERQIATGE